jgi:Leucine-rich repeat (LRR) protein
MLTSITPLANLSKLAVLYLDRNAVSDIAPISALPALNYIGLYANSLTSIAPLVQSAGVGNGDAVDVQENPLNCATESANVSTLIARGVSILSSCNP